MNSHIKIFCVYFLICILPCQAQLPYRTLSSMPAVNASGATRDASNFAEDADGMIWISSTNGLVRYNGTHYFYYTSSPDSTSIPDNYINGILRDSSNNLWVSTNDGLGLYNREAGFKREVINDSYKPTYGITDKDSLTLFVATDKGISVLDKKEMKRKQSIELLSCSRASHLCYSNQGVLGAINRYYPAIEFLSSELHYLSSLPLVQTPKGIATDTEGNFFYYINDGLHFITHNGLQEAPLPSWLDSFKGKILFLMQIRGNFLYLGVSEEGVYRCDFRNHEVEQLCYNVPLGSHSRAFVDSKEGLWIAGKANFHLDYYPLKSLYFSVPPSLNREIQQFQGVSRFIRGLRNDYWITTRDNHVIYYNPDVRQIKVWPQTSSVHSLVHANATHLYTYVDNLQNIVEHEFDGKDIKQVRQFSFNRIALGYARDRNGWTWIAKSDSSVVITRDSVYSIANPGGVEFRKVFYGEYSGRIFLVSLDHGIYAVENDKRIIQILDNRDLGITNVKFFHEDSEGNYWLGTISKGVYRYDVSSKKLIYYNADNGLTNNSIVGMVESKGYIFVMTANGLNAIELKSGKVRKIFFDGKALQNLFIEDGGQVAPDGTVYIATVGGIIHFDPSILIEEKKTPLYIERVMINNRQIGQVNHDGEFQSFTFDAKELSKLPFDQNYLEFHFYGIDYENSTNLLYSYRLVGLSDQWTLTTNTYTNYAKLPSGKYRFEVRLMNESNQWSEPISLSFRIRPPFWLSIWAWIIYIVLVVAVLAFSIKLYLCWQMNKATIRFMEQDSLVNKRMSEMKINFFTNISHEFRTPLTLITSPLRQLKDNRDLDGKDKAFLFSIVERNVQKMLRLTEELLQYNRKEGLQPHLDLSYADLFEYVRETVGIFQYNAEMKGITINLVEGEPVLCSFDAPKLNDILSNLLTNAIKYSPRRKNITVQVEVLNRETAMRYFHMEMAEYEKYVEISVLDNGMGMSDEQKKQIFSRNFRTEEAMDLIGVKGFGIGLHYTHQLLEILGGCIKVRDNHPIGSVFSFIIPYIGKDEARYESQNATNSLNELVEIEGRYLEKQVIVVEDDADMRMYLERMLNKYYNVIALSNGQECLDYLADNSADLIACDRMMPVMDGDTLCRKLRESEDNLALPIIMLTAKTDKISQIQGLNLGVDAYLSKPFDLNYLIATINNLLKKRSSLQQKVLSLTSTTIDETGFEENDKFSSQDKEFLNKLYELLDMHLHEMDFRVNP